MFRTLTMYVCLSFFSAMAQVQAKELFVSTTGNDAVAYADNSLSHPWATPNKAWAEARSGDTVYFRGGTFHCATPVNTSSTGNHGTADHPIRFTSYPGEHAVLEWLDCTAPEPFVAALSIYKDYNEIDNLEIRSSFTGTTYLGGSTIYSFAAHTRITRCTIRLLQVVRPDNSAPIVFYASSHFGEVSNCRVIGFDTLRSSGVHMFRTKGIRVQNNEISNCVHAIYLKHSNTLEDRPEWTNYFENNYIHGCVDGIHGVPNRTIIRNNLLVGCDLSFGGDGGLGDGYVGGDYNTLANNTIYNGNFEYVWGGRPLSEDPLAGNMFNTIRNNVFHTTSVLRWHAYNQPAVDYDYRNDTDHNLYPDRNPLIAENWNTSYSLPQWVQRISSLFSRSVDAHSLVGVPVFVGGNAPVSISDYALATGSPGKHGGSDGRDMGADMSLVGIKSSDLTLTAPNGQETWRWGEQRQITWTASRATGPLDIELLQNGSLRGTIATGVDPVTESYTWTVGRLEDGRWAKGQNLSVRIRTASDSAPASRRKK